MGRWRSIEAAGLLTMAAAASAGTPTPFAPPAASHAVLYRHATLIDGTGAPARADMDVLVDGERIVRVMRDRDRDTGAAAAETVDLTGRYLIPGLIDSHVHLATPPNRRQAEAMLRRDLYGGVTTVRDMADDLRAVADLARATRVGEIAGPDIYFAALMAGPEFFADPRTAQVSAGVALGTAPWMQAVTTATDLPLAVAMARGTGATALKLYADLPPDLVARITAEAHRQHLLVWSHATIFPAKPSDAVAAGVDVLSHACLLIHQAAKGPLGLAPGNSQAEGVDPVAFANGDDPILTPVFAAMARRGTMLDATDWVYDTPLGDPALWKARRHCDGAIGAAITAQAHRAGVAVVTGTDQPAQWDDPWPDVFHEIEYLVAHAGFTPAAAIRAATLDAARAAGQDGERGSIAPGKLADMVVLARDPLADIAALRSLVFTLKRGRTFLRGDFVPLAQGDITDF